LIGRLTKRISRSPRERAGGTAPMPGQRPGRPEQVAPGIELPMPTVAREATAGQVAGFSAAEAPRTPEQRWRAAVKSMPLESPRPFPASLRPLVARLAGSASRAAYTTGPATRRALGEVGALGATTGSVVHLARKPSTDSVSMGVLAHELTHARNPISRPRFMLHAPGGSMDADERSARAVGNEVTRGGGPGILVQRMPDPSNVLGGLGSQVGNAAGSAASQAGQAVSGAAGGVAKQLGSTVAGLGDRVAAQAGSISAGIVDALKVGGASATGAVDAARNAVEQGVRQTANSVVQEASSAGSELDSGAQNMLSQLDALIGNAGANAQQMASGAAGAVEDGLASASGAVTDAAGGALSQAQNAVAGVASKAAGGLAAASGMAKADLDRIAEALEERILREIERRGGRYAGVF
jgi:hypothetical protein